MYAVRVHITLMTSESSSLYYCCYSYAREATSIRITYLFVGCFKQLRTHLTWHLVSVFVKTWWTFNRQLDGFFATDPNWASALKEPLHSGPNRFGSRVQFDWKLNFFFKEGRKEGVKQWTTICWPFTVFMVCNFRRENYWHLTIYSTVLFYYSTTRILSQGILQSKSFIWVTSKYLGSCWSYRKTKTTLLDQTTHSASYESSYRSLRETFVK